MNKKCRRFGKWTVGVSVIYICLQVYAWYHVTESDSNSDAKEELQGFLRSCKQRDVSVFIIDTVVLGNMLSHHNGGKQCFLLCGNSNNSLTFGVEGSQVNQLSQFLVSCFTRCLNGTVPGVEGRGKVLPVYCVLQTRSLSLHLLIFYSVIEDFWWHGSVQETNHMYSFGEGIFKRIHTREVDLGGFQVRVPQSPSAFLREKEQSKFISCNHSRADNFFHLFGKDESEAGKLFNSNARALLKRVKEVLDDLKVPFWLSSGTCLGWFRQCDFITYSQDVDIGVFIKDYVPSVVPKVLDAGLQLKHKYGKIEDSFQLAFQADDLKLDIFFFYEQGDIMWNAGTELNSGKKYKYTFPKFTLCWTLFLSMLVRVPCKTESYIHANYGKDWFIPVKSWSWKESPFNVEPNGVWPREDWDQVLNEYG